MSLGDQTVKVVAITDGAPDRNNVPTLVRTLVTWPGVHFRPLTFKEKVGLVDNIATELWQLTGEPTDQVLAAKSVDEILYDRSADPADVDANRFQIVGGVQPFNDLGPDVFKVTVLCQKQNA